VINSSKQGRVKGQHIIFRKHLENLKKLFAQGVSAMHASVHLLHSVCVCVCVCHLKHEMYLSKRYFDPSQFFILK
jgi:hypothetical protein